MTSIKHNVIMWRTPDSV